MAEQPNALAWMPLFISEFQALSANLSPAQLGALMRLRAYAWAEPRPCTLPDSDARLAAISGLGEAWEANADVMREYFVPSEPDAQGKPRLIDHELEALYAKQLAKYLSASNRGGKGGRPPKSGKQTEKLGESSAFVSASNQLRNPLSSELKSVSQNTEQEKADGKQGKKLSFPTPNSVEAKMRAQESDWLASPDGQAWREANPDADVLPAEFYLSLSRKAAS